ncbi:hypothetical protein V6N13_054638 [Hibiscus sabdariffa]|uniref:Uncharacterized protein n=1 Tax=Hibiscus sabdariffa TaxID=183260 RepID=A0ABR2DX74_9ROSI
MKKLAPDVGDLGGGASFDLFAGEPDGGEVGGDGAEVAEESASACVWFIFGPPGGPPPLTTVQRQLGLELTTLVNFVQQVAVGVDEFPLTKSRHGVIVIRTTLQFESATVRANSAVTVTITIARPGSKVTFLDAVRWIVGYMGTGLYGLCCGV